MESINIKYAYDKCIQRRARHEMHAGRERQKAACVIGRNNSEKK